MPWTSRPSAPAACTRSRNSRTGSVLDRVAPVGEQRDLQVGELRADALHEGEDGVPVDAVGQRAVGRLADHGAVAGRVRERHGELEAIHPQGVQPQHELAQHVERRIARRSGRPPARACREAARRRSGALTPRRRPGGLPWARIRSISLAGSPLAITSAASSSAAGQSSTTPPFIARAAAFSLMLSSAAGGPSPPISARKWPTVSSRSSTGSRSSNEPAPRPSSRGSSVNSSSRSLS